MSDEVLDGRSHNFEAVESVIEDVELLPDANISKAITESESNQSTHEEVTLVLHLWHRSANHGKRVVEDSDCDLFLHSSFDSLVAVVFYRSKNRNSTGEVIVTCLVVL